MDLRPICCQFYDLRRAKPFDFAKHGVVPEHARLKSKFVKPLAIECDARQGCSRCEKRRRKQVQLAVMIERKTRKIVTENECPTALMQHGSKLTGELRLIEVRQPQLREPFLESRRARLSIIGECSCCDREAVAAFRDKFGTTIDVGSMHDGPAGHLPFDQGGEAMTRELVVSRFERPLLPFRAVSHQKKAAHAIAPHDRSSPGRVACKGSTRTWCRSRDEEDDGGNSEKGQHSVGVTRPYCGQLGTQDCQVTVHAGGATGEAAIICRSFTPYQDGFRNTASI